jgi:hypothetical protein
MNVFQGIGIVTVTTYSLSVLCIGFRKTNAYVMAIPTAIRCMPAIIVKHVENNGPYPEAKNVFTRHKST